MKLIILFSVYMNKVYYFDLFVFSVSKQIDQIDLDGQYLKKNTIDFFKHLKTLGSNFSIYLESCCFVSFLFIFFS